MTEDDETLKLLFIAALGAAGWAIKMIFKREPEHEEVDAVSDVVDDERELTYEYENADSNELLDARLKCLRLAVHYGGTADPEKAIPLAQKYWEFIKYNPKED